MATKRHNYGNNLGIIAACLVLNFWKLFLLLLIILWLPLSLLAIIGIVVGFFLLISHISKENK